MMGVIRGTFEKVPLHPQNFQTRICIAANRFNRGFVYENMKRAARRQPFFIVWGVSSVAAAANAGQDQQGDDDEPNNLVIEKIAKAVHRFSFLVYDCIRSFSFLLQYHSMTVSRKMCRGKIFVRIFQNLLQNTCKSIIIVRQISGCSSMAELQLPKLITRVRFPSSAPKNSHHFVIGNDGCFFFRLTFYEPSCGALSQYASKNSKICSVSVSSKRMLCPLSAYSTKQKRASSLNAA